MAIADTAQLSVLLSLKDELSPGLARAKGELAGMSAAAGSVGGTLTSKLSGATGAIGKIETGFRNAAGAALSFVKGVGLIGGGIAAAGAVGLLKESIAQAADFGAEVRRLSALTGQSAESMSTLAAAFDHFGISAESAQRSIGFLEKNVGLLAAKKDGIVKFQQEFGFQILDTNGKIKSANELILTTADYFNNKAIPATEKAAAISKLYGRSWQDLIPILSAGRAGIAAAEQEAQTLGLTLTSQNLDDLIKLRDATREWDTALAGLKLQIGLAAVPALTDLAKAGRDFLANGGRQQIVDFFKQGIQFGRELGRVIKDDVIPVFQGIASAWNSLPPEVKDLLIKGFVLNKAAKMTIGIDIFGSVKDAAGGALGGLLGKIGGSLFSRGGTPANPLFVADVTGGLGGAVGAAEGAVGLGGALAGGAAVVGAAALYSAAQAGSFRGAQDALVQSGLTRGEAVAYQLSQESAAARQNAMMHGAGSAFAGSTYEAELASALAKLNANNANAIGEHSALGAAQVNAANKANALLGAGLTQGHRDMDKLNGTVVGGIAHLVDAIHQDFARNMAALRAATDPRKAISAVEAVVKDIMKGVGNVRTTEGVIAELQRLRAIAVKNGDRADVTKIDKAIAQATNRLDNRRIVEAQLAKADSILRSSESTKAKIADLQRIQDTLGHRSIAATNAVAADIRRLKTSVAVNTKINVNVSPAVVQHVFQVQSTYGEVPMGGNKL